ncbi:DUF2917 domain-containing protein [Chitinibacter sp. SCUT-21]|uniref:DUF2917 domain-containing protein n=1 Tax=Chitinibacter sp. SCUT-21 TaxID=2970891 RepID=UPI0035A70926
MERYLRLQLHADELLLARLGRDAQLSCESGQLWLASNRNNKDIVLNAGEQHAIGAGHVLIEGQGELRFSGEELDIRPYYQSLMRNQR